LRGGYVWYREATCIEGTCPTFLEKMEIRREHSDIPGIGMIGGNPDFFAKVNGNIDLRKHGEQIPATQPYLTVIEIKKVETVRALSFATQLIAQLF
jgi:hypothetical protein